MSQPTTAIGFSPTTPAAPAGYVNTTPQTDGGTPLQKVSEYVANVGGVSAKTANYTAIAGDNGTLLVFNSASALTLTLPAAPPMAIWNISVQNIGAGVLTINRNGLLIDTAAANLTLIQNVGISIFTDGSNYFTERGGTGAAGSAGVIYAADTGSANTYAATGTPSLVTGLAVDLKVANTNTGASTFNYNGGGAVAIKKTNGATALSGGELVGGQVSSLVYDGTVWQLVGGSGGGGGGGSSFYGNATATAGTNQNQITFGSTPIADTVFIFQNGQEVSPALWNLSGAVLTMPSFAFASGAQIDAIWATTNSTPGGITLSASGAGYPLLRATSELLPTSGTGLIPIPTGAQPGDLAVIFNCGTTSTPSGWTVTSPATGGFFITGYVFSKILTAGDITTGPVALTAGNSAAMAVFQGPTGGIREADVAFNTYSSSPVSAPTTSGAVAATDVALLFGVIGQTSGAQTASCNLGTVQQAGTPSQYPFCLNFYQVPGAGAFTPQFTYSTVSNRYYQAAVIVEAIATTLPPLPLIVDNPMTTEGDLIVGGTGGTPIRLGAGATTFVLTSNGAGALPSWQAPGGGGGGGAAGLFAGLITSVPTISGIGLSTALAQSGTFAAANNANGVSLIDTATISPLVEGTVKTYPGVAFTLTALLSNPFVQFTNNALGLVIANTVTGKLMTFAATSSIAGVFSYNTPTSFNGTLVSSGITASPFWWLRLKDNGTNITYSISSDGIVFQQIYTVAKSSSWLGASGFNFIGVYVSPQGGPIGTNIQSWIITTP